MAYTYETFANVVTAVANRLYDATKQQWGNTELETIVVESLRTWNALSQFWRTEFAFNLSANNWWYDLRTANNTVIPYTVTQQQVIEKIERHLLEPANANAWTGSTQFTLNDLLNACRRRLDETIGQSACTISRNLVTAALTRRTEVADSIIDIRRITWIPDTGLGYSNKIMRQADAWAMRAFNPGYMQANNNTPTQWLQNTEPPPSFDVDFIPPVAGNYEVLSTQSGGAWTGGNNTLTVPDDWCWVFQFGAMADLFSRESLSADPLRAAYCRARYEEGIGLLRLMPVILALRLNEVPMSIGAVTGGDHYNPLWQTVAAGSPASAYTFMNLLAFSPMPANNNFTATVSVTRNIDTGNNFVQVARDDLDTIIDYAQHLAMLKQGGEEFYKTIPLYQNMQRKAASYNGKLYEMGFFELDQLDLATLEERSRNPRFQKGSEPSPVVSA